jgi:hypothetical protein
MDLPHDYFKTFSCIVGNLFNLIFPYIVAYPLTKYLAGILLPAEDAEFLMNVYMPELRSHTMHLATTKDEKISLFNKLCGTLVKLGVSFMYQEHYVKLPEQFYEPVPMQIAAALLPYVNSMASQISGFPQTDEAVNEAKGVYPGDETCRV